MSCLCQKLKTLLGQASPCSSRFPRPISRNNFTKFCHFAFPMVRMTNLGNIRTIYANAIRLMDEQYFHDPRSTITHNGLK